MEKKKKPIYILNQIKIIQTINFLINKIFLSLNICKIKIIAGQKCLQYQYVFNYYDRLKDRPISGIIGTQTAYPLTCFRVTDVITVSPLELEWSCQSFYRRHSLLHHGGRHSTTLTLHQLKQTVPQFTLVRLSSPQFALVGIVSAGAPLQHPLQAGTKNCSLDVHLKSYPQLVMV